MRSPSRNMEPFGRINADEGLSLGWLPWVYFGSATLILIYGLTRNNEFLAPGVYLGIGLMVFGLWIMRESRIHDQHMDAFIRSRAEDSICSFARDCGVRDGIDPWAIRAVFDGLGWLVGTTNRDFHPRAQDNLWTEMRLDEDDLDLDLWPLLCHRTGRDPDAKNPVGSYPQTVCDLVVALHHQPRARNHGA